MSNANIVKHSKQTVLIDWATADHDYEQHEAL